MVTDPFSWIGDPYPDYLFILLFDPFPDRDPQLGNRSFPDIIYIFN